MSANCRCGHNVLAHELDGIAPQCSATACTCLQYRPPIVAAPASIETPAIEAVLEEAKTRTPKIRRLAERIEEYVEQLRDLVEADNDAAAARAEIAELEAKLRAAKAKIAHPKKTTPASAGLVCPDCGRSFLTPQARGAHRKAHGHRRRA